MEANAALPSSHHPFPFTKRPSLIRNPMHLLRLTTLRAAGPSSTNSSSSGGGGGGENGSTTTNNNEIKTDAASDARPPISTLNIRYKPRSKRQAAKLQQQQSIKASPPPPPKDWESMTLGEKAVELYVGEKGLLFWLNKFAYASIFIIIGGWILFRFVGPNLGLYQLDAPPLSPTSILKGSS